MADGIAEAFEARVADWPAKLAADEWFFTAVRAELVAALRPTAAFEATGDAASLVLRLGEPTLKAEAAELLLALARRSGTTEVCEPLARGWGQVMATWHRSGLTARSWPASWRGGIVARRASFDLARQRAWPAASRIVLSSSNLARRYAEFCR